MQQPAERQQERDVIDARINAFTTMAHVLSKGLEQYRNCNEEQRQTPRLSAVKLLVEMMQTAGVTWVVLPLNDQDQQTQNDAPRNQDPETRV